MNWSSWIRQTHRWVAIVFTVTVIANFIALARGVEVFAAVRQVPGEANDVAGLGAGLGQHGGHVAERLPRLRHEVVALEHARLRVPPDLATDEEDASLGNHAVRIPLRGHPPGRVQDLRQTSHCLRGHEWTSCSRRR